MKFLYEKLSPSPILSYIITENQKKVFFCVKATEGPKTPEEP